MATTLKYHDEHRHATWLTAGLFFYVFSNFKWTLTRDVSPYLDD